MKTLTLLRHAKSGHDSDVARDFDRALNAKGKRAALVMGRHARALGLIFDTVIASPAIRVSETLDAFGEGYGKMPPPAWDRRVYLASAATLLDLVQAGGLNDNILIIGHNPGLEDLALMLSRDNDARRAIEDKFPTASIARLSLDGDWADVRAGSGTLDLFVRPRDIDPSLGPDF